jgi:hypothetical protein
MLPPSSAARTAILAEDALVHVHVHKVQYRNRCVPGTPQGLLVCLLTRCVGNTQTTRFVVEVSHPGHIWPTGRLHALVSLHTLNPSKT